MKITPKQKTYGFLGATLIVLTVCGSLGGGTESNNEVQQTSYTQGMQAEDLNNRKDYADAMNGNIAKLNTLLSEIGGILTYEETMDYITFTYKYTKLQEDLGTLKTAVDKVDAKSPYKIYHKEVQKIITSLQQDNLKVDINANTKEYSVGEGSKETYLEAKNSWDNLASTTKELKENTTSAIEDRMSSRGY